MKAKKKGFCKVSFKKTSVKISYCEFIHGYLYSCANRPQSPDKQARTDNGKPLSCPLIKTGTTGDFGVTPQCRVAFPVTSGVGNPCWLCCSLLQVVDFSAGRTPYVFLKERALTLRMLVIFSPYFLFVWSKNKGATHTPFLFCFSDWDCSVIASAPTLDGSHVRPSSRTASENGRSLRMLPS